MRTLTFITLSALSVWGQDAGIGFRAPALGYIVDPTTASIRSILGVSGASTLSAPLYQNIRAASISPDGSAAIVITDDGASFVSALNTDTPATRLIDATGNAIRAAWDNGSAVAQIGDSWYRFGSDGTIMYFKLPQNDTVNAVSYDDAQRRFYVAYDQAGLYSVSLNDGSSTQLSILTRISQFVRLKSGTIEALNPDAIWTVSNQQTTRFVTLPAGTGIAVSQDYQRLYALSGNQLLVYHASTAEPLSSIDLPITPASLERLSPSTLLLSTSTSNANQPLWLIDDLATGPQVFFVPAAPKARVQQ